MTELVRAAESELDTAAAEAAPALDSSKWLQYAELADGSGFVRIPEVVEFLISASGERIACRDLAGGGREMLETYALNQALSFALLAQGLEPVHSTVVVTDRGAVGLLGHSGRGKSTLAAYMLSKGDRLLTDDLLLVEEHDGQLLAQPGPPRIKCFPETADALLPDHAQGVPMNPMTHKQIIPLDDRWACPSPVPLQGIYALMPALDDQPGGVVTRPLSPREAFVELTRHTFNNVIRSRQRLQRHFGQTRAIVERIPVRALHYPRELQRLPEVREAILADLDGAGADSKVSG